MVTDVEAPLTANVWKIVKQAGDAVTEGEVIAILESMKMEIPVEAPVGGTLAEILIKEGGTVDEGDIVARIE